VNTASPEEFCEDQSIAGPSTAGVEQLLVGVDGSAASIAALHWSRRLARLSGQRVTAIYAFTPTYAEVGPDQYQELHSGAEEALVLWCGGAEEIDGVTPLVVGGGPGALLTVADQHRDVLVVGTSGASGFAHLHLGSVAHHLAHHTSTPLAIVPTAAAADGVSRIVVGVDGSQGSAVALRFCMGLAARVGAAVVAVHAVEDHADPGPQRDVEASVRAWTAPIEAAGVPVTVAIEHDLHPVAALCRAIEAAPNTLAVVGTRGLGGFSGLRLGRVPIHLVHSTDATVVMVPAPPEQT
jgi:nucleotide-binding universal stress UspA family protein